MNLTNLSKYISLILRHKPEVIGITLDEHGWANVADLIAGIARDNDFNMAMLEEIVRTDEKQRYSFNDDKTLIRANQGHSIPVDVELSRQTPPEILWHGTGEKYVTSIDAEGLIPKSRLYVHLSANEDTALNVGARHGSPVIYKVMAKQMHDDGYEFFISANGVWLTKEVPAKYLEKVTHPDHIQIFVYGTLMKGQPAHTYLSGAKYVGTYRLSDYAMYNLGYFPGIKPCEGESVIGEVYEITEDMLHDMDRYESEGSLYTRKELPVSNPDSETKAFVYVYNHEVSGTPMRNKWGS